MRLQQAIGREKAITEISKGLQNGSIKQKTGAAKQARPAVKT